MNVVRNTLFSLVYLHPNLCKLVNRPLEVVDFILCQIVALPNALDGTSVEAKCFCPIRMVIFRYAKVDQDIKVGYGFLRPHIIHGY
jgi:hypothetical protein